MILLTKTANKKLLIWSILLMALLQMPNLALTPAIHGIHEAFPERALSTIQTTMALTGLISPFVAVASAFAIGRGLVTKKHVIVTGLLLVALTGALSLVAHTRFWHLVMLSCILGVGMSGYLSNGVSLIADNFPMGERQRITGFQTSFINGGGILMSLCGGLLATGSWHGGYLMLLIALPVAIVAMAGIPNVKLPRGGGKKDAGAGTGKLKLHPDIFLFGILIFVFMTVYNVIGANISGELLRVRIYHGHPDAGRGRVRARVQQTVAEAGRLHHGPGLPGSLRGYVHPEHGEEHPVGDRRRVHRGHGLQPAAAPVPDLDLPGRERTDVRHRDGHHVRHRPEFRQFLLRHDIHEHHDRAVRGVDRPEIPVRRLRGPRPGRGLRDHFHDQKEEESG